MYTVPDAGRCQSRAPAAAPTTALAPTRADEAYRLLKTWVLRGEFALNLRLVESRLAATLDISRTPVREALRRLSGEGLVEPHPDGGFRPCVPDTEMMRQFYEVRAGLELQGIRRPAQHGRRHDDALLRPLRDRWRAMAAGPLPVPDPDFVLIDEQFHETLALAAGNRVAAELLHQVNERIRVIRMHDFLIEERIEATVREHLEIVELVLDGDLHTAETAFTAHLAGSMAVVEERSRDAVMRMAGRGPQ